MKLFATQSSPSVDYSKWTCSTCRFWKPRKESAFGACRRRCPLPSPNGALPLWPQTHQFDTCGEFEFVPGVPNKETLNAQE